ncbi:MAG: S8 family serine peptidase, partial [Myxococcota bacterium]
AGWRTSPADAPALSGKACERILELASVALADGDAEQSGQLVRLVRARARNRNSAFAGTTLLAEGARRTGGEEAVAAIFRELPRTRLGGATVIFQIFQEQAQLDAQLAQTKTQIVSLDTAKSALYFSLLLPDVVQNRAMFLAAAEAVRAEHAEAPPLSEYAFSTVALTDAADAQPVHVAVWDVGTNPALFENQLYRNAAEEANGQDDDGNGLVDDLHGVVHEIGEHTHQDLLFDPGQEVLAEYAPFLRGVMDLRAGIATSDAAQRVLGLMRSASTPERLEELDINLSAVGEWAHGTHVAGILIAGLPQAQLSIFRSTWAGEARPYHHRGPTDEELAGERANVDAIAAYINAHQVRVVNASLGFSLDYIASALRHEGDTYATEAAVMERAGVVQAHRRATWERIFAACPETLFVVAAGNSNQDVLEYGDTPADIVSANLLVIGAVDRYGAWATFTNSNAERVRVFDFGVEVPSLVPDGSTVPLSGTSMASPNAANLAAKVLSVNPALTPAQVIALIEETATPIAEPFGGRIVHEADALARARALRDEASP